MITCLCQYAVGVISQRRMPKELRFSVLVEQIVNTNTWSTGPSGSFVCTRIADSVGHSSVSWINTILPRDLTGALSAGIVGAIVTWRRSSHG